jgi:hypothetical protein
MSQSGAFAANATSVVSAATGGKPHLLRIGIPSMRASVRGLLEQKNCLKIQDFAARCHP